MYTIGPTHLYPTLTVVYHTCTDYTTLTVILPHPTKSNQRQRFRFDL